jgi:hypothetical protein
MDDGLREAIALADTVAGGEAKRPLVIELMIDQARQLQGLVRQMRAQPQPDERMVRDWLKLANKFGRSAVRFLRPGGELRRRLESGELMSEEEWERLCGPPLPPAELRLLQP